MQLFVRNENTYIPLGNFSKYFGGHTKNKLMQGQKFPI